MKNQYQKKGIVKKCKTQISKQVKETTNMIECFTICGIGVCIGYAACYVKLVIL